MKNWISFLISAFRKRNISFLFNFMPFPWISFNHQVINNLRFEILILRINFIHLWQPVLFRPSWIGCLLLNLLLQTTVFVNKTAKKMAKRKFAYSDYCHSFRFFKCGSLIGLLHYGVYYFDKVGNIFFIQRNTYEIIKCV